MLTWEEAVSDADFWASLAGRPVVLLMDFDGTLSPFTADPSAARPYPGVREALDGLAGAGCRLVFVTGRDCRRLPGLLGLSAAPEVWGSHGGERLHPDGTVEPLRLAPGLGRGLDRARDWAVDAGWAAALETKPGSCAFHVRGMPEARRAGALDAAREAWGAVGREHGLTLRAFDGGVELRAPGIHKGLAVDAVLAEAGRGAAAFYLGDDATDEDAFAAIRGRGVGILVRGALRGTGAAWWLRPPGELLKFLDALAAAGRGG